MFYSLRPRFSPLFGLGFSLLALLPVLAWAAVEEPESAVARQLREFVEADQDAQAVAWGEAHPEEVNASAQLAQLMAESSYEIDDIEGTKRYALRALELDSSREYAARLYVSACRDQDRYDEGLKFGREWTARNSNGTDIYKDLALLAHDADRVQEAYAFATEAFTRKPENTRIAGVYFYLRCVAGDPKEVAGAAEEWAGRYKPDTYFWAQLGKGLSDAELPEVALPYLLRAFREKSRDVGVTDEIMDCYRGLGDRAAAAKFIASYEEVQGRAAPASAWRTLGAMHFDAEAYGEALTTFQKSQRMDPDSGTTVANLMFTLNALRRSQEAIAEGQRWLNLELTAPTPAFHRALGNAYFARDRWFEAEPHYREAVRMDPSRIADVRELVTVLLKQERIEEAYAFGRAWRAAHPAIEDNGLDALLVEKAEAASANEPVAAAKSG